ncbi:hypothetical protein Ahy_B05g077699 [Arachis hypogaea]|uniref:BED-type domain-containing protein n=1 Tax=Arachis hypogaea TaxID=3818 RepID=A0A444Z593_ARAHY|nr:hypothetical protein Ahy_B05g077699 [Arachis hypogaea]
MNSETVSNLVTAGVGSEAAPVEVDKPSSKRLRPARSNVWNFFKKLGPDKDGVERSECKGCKKVFEAGDFVGVLCRLKRKRDVECNGNILKVMILEVFADGKKISCNLIGDCCALIDINSLKSRLRSNEIGDLVSVIDDESFDWKLIRTIAYLKGNNEMLVLIRPLSQYLKTSLSMDSLEMMTTKVECIDAMRRYRIKIIVSHSNGSKIFILEDDEVMQILKKSCSKFLKDETNFSEHHFSIDEQKIVFIVDPRPVGYELNTSLHIVYAIYDDIDIVKFFEDSTHDNQ